MQTSRPLCVLIGPPGSGKSTVGRLVSVTAGAVLRDTDDIVEQAAGKPISEVLVDDGEAVLRSMEREAVTAALGTPSAVVALGSGAVLDPQVRAELAGHVVVHLSAQLATVTRRTAMTSGGQFAGIAVRAMLKSMLEERAELYRGLATVTLATDERTPEAVAAELVQALRRV